ncbi:MAG TPA: tetratricopeptide repeat protein [Armatimonadota bacterium]|nr:tetratricopeptide repeat protein [Armatimonadota bacterium]
MNRLKPLFAFSVLAAVVGLARSAEAQAPPTVRQRVTIAQIVSLTDGLPYKATAIALEDTLALKLRHTGRCEVTDRQQFLRAARAQNLPVNDPAEIRAALVELGQHYGILGTVTAEGTLVNAQISIVVVKPAERTTAVLTNLEIKGGTVGMLGFMSAVAERVATEMQIPMDDATRAVMNSASPTAVEAAMLPYYEGRALLNGTTMADCDLAAQKFGEALAADEGFRDARVGLGSVKAKKAELLAAQGDLDGALAALGEAAYDFNTIGQSVSYADVQEQAAGIYDTKGDQKLRVKCLHNAARALIRNAGTNELGRAEALLKTITGDQATAETSFLRGQVLRQTSRRIRQQDIDAGGTGLSASYKEAALQAAFYFDDAYKRNPEGALRVELLLEMGDFYRSLHDRNAGDSADGQIMADCLKRSTDALNEACTLDPTNWQPYLELGLSYEAAESYDQAENAFRRALENIPDDRPGLQSAALEGIGRCMFKRKEYDKACPILEQAIQKEPANHQAAVRLVLAYAYTNQFGPARQLLQTIMQPYAVVPTYLTNLMATVEKMEQSARDQLDAPRGMRDKEKKGQYGGRYDELQQKQRERELEEERAKAQGAGRR